MTVRFENLKFVFDNGLVISVDDRPPTGTYFDRLLTGRDKNAYGYYQTIHYDIVLMIEQIGSEKIKFSLINRFFAYNSYDKYMHSIDVESYRKGFTTLMEITVRREDCIQALTDFVVQDEETDEESDEESDEE